MNTMTRVVVHIGRMVVHGSEGFASEAFGASLQQQISLRIAEGANVGDIVRRLQGNAVSVLHSGVPGQMPHGRSLAGGPAEELAATEVAGRIFK